MMKTAMGADRCEVILADQFNKLAELGFARSIAQQAIHNDRRSSFKMPRPIQPFGKSAALLHIHGALCVPVMSGDQILGLIYVFKNRPRARPLISATCN